MINPSSMPAQAFDACRQIAAELAIEATDPAADLTMPERRALAALSLSVDAEASRRAGVEPVAGAGDALAEDLALLEGASR